MRPIRETARPARRTLLAAAAVAWATGIVWGFATLLDYGSRPGPAPAPPPEWPAGVALTPAAGTCTLLLAAHPQCPCTRATIAELDRLMAEAAGSVSATVLFYSDPAFPADWTRSGLWEHAERIPGVAVRADVGGQLAAAFGLRTSGSVLLYDPGGHLRFRGGITAGRGHEGDNPGRAAIVAIVTGGTGAAATPVFGCELTTPAAGATRP